MASKQAVFNCCTTFWRVIFLILNIIFLLIGMGLIALGIYLLASGNSLELLTGNRYASGGALILISGIVTFIFALVGIVGAAGMWPAVLIFYIIFMVLVIILEIVAGVLGFVYRNDVEDFVVQRALGAIDDYNVQNNDVTALLDFIQQQFRCCGFDSSDDWLDTMYFNETMLYPGSCNCTNTTTSSLECVTLPDSPNQMIYNRNCSSSVRGFIEENLIAIGAVGVVFGVIQLIGLAIGIGLCACFCIMRRDQEDYDIDVDKAI